VFIIEFLQFDYVEENRNMKDYEISKSSLGNDFKKARNLFYDWYQIHEFLWE
tara:strand:+ start:17613 stop:17768 length:156 start_codon:yes stop_codon:yes gene_type:complete